ncbi:MAG TPA: NUDIX hydrolase [Candidatus Nanoarchaeia archaeon]|nr:NUDIX hydrolase [Candidatus Nanoarchaeia archaeon]
MIAKGCGGVIINHEKEVLLIKRKNNSTFNNLWSNPGSLIEPEETEERAVIRELEEEIGVTVKIIRKLGDYQHFENTILKGIFGGYLVEIVEGIPTIKEPNKIADLQYFPLASLPENLAPFTKYYLDNLEV